VTYNPAWGSVAAYPWVNAGAIILGSRVKASGAAGAAPTKGAAPTIDAFRYKRIGDTMLFRAEYRQASAGAQVASVFYTFKLPSGLTIDTAKQPIIGGGVINEAQMGKLSAYRIGDGLGQTNAGQDLNTFTSILAYTNDEFCIAVNKDVLWDNASGPAFNDNPMGFVFTGIVPITGWT